MNAVLNGVSCKGESWVLVLTHFTFLSLLARTVLDEVRLVFGVWYFDFCVFNDFDILTCENLKISTNKRKLEKTTKITLTFLPHFLSVNNRLTLLESCPTCTFRLIKHAPCADLCVSSLCLIALQSARLAETTSPGTLDSELPRGITQHHQDW